MTLDPYAHWWRRTPSKRGKASVVNAQGRPITKEGELERVRRLRLPPAWSDVRISPFAKAKLQAVGLDAKGRRQYIYHSDWVSARAEAKYLKLLEFAQRLPHFREATSSDLAGEGPTRYRVLALVTRLIGSGCFRIGGERYARENKSYGIATLCNRHLDLGETCLRFCYRGKRGVLQQKVVADPDLVEIMREIRALPGKRLFQYRAEGGAVVPVTGREVNSYIKELMGPAISAKDFRTWNGTLMAARILAAYGPADTARERKRREVCAVRAVSRYLGNTPAIAKASYISPKVFDAYEQGLTLLDFAPRGKRQVRLLEAGHTAEEIELMKLLSAQVVPALRVSMLETSHATQTSTLASP
jgi:DNA topoisomerase-1